MAKHREEETAESEVFEKLVIESLTDVITEENDIPELVREAVTAQVKEHLEDIDIKEKVHEHIGERVEELDMDDILQQAIVIASDKALAQIKTTTV